MTKRQVRSEAARDAVVDVTVARQALEALTAGESGSWLLCWPPLVIDMQHVQGPSGAETWNALFDAVPVQMETGFFIAGGVSVDALYRELVPPSSDSAGGATPTSGADMGAWAAMDNHARQDVEDARLASGFAVGREWLAVELQPATIDAVQPVVAHLPVGGGVATLSAQFGRISIRRPWLNVGLLSSANWYWPGHAKFAIAGAPQGRGLMEAVSVEALLVWTAIVVTTDGVLSQRLSIDPPWKVLGMRTEPIPPCPPNDSQGFS